MSIPTGYCYKRSSISQTVWLAIYISMQLHSNACHVRRYIIAYRGIYAQIYYYAMAHNSKNYKHDNKHGSN